MAALTEYVAAREEHRRLFNLNQVSGSRDSRAHDAAADRRDALRLQVEAELFDHKAVPSPDGRTCRVCGRFRQRVRGRWLHDITPEVGR